jgi:hypothetical protein
MNQTYPQCTAISDTPARRVSKGVLYQNLAFWQQVKNGDLVA